MAAPTAAVPAAAAPAAAAPAAVPAAAPPAPSPAPSPADTSVASASDAPRDGGAAATVTTTFFLVRHGETPWNVEGVMQGQEDVPLNAAGWAQAHAAGVYLASTYGGTAGGEWLLVASDLTRATDTARAIGGQMSLPVYTLPALRETHLGDWQGHTWHEVLATWPGEAAAWRRDPDAAPPGAGGESFRHRFYRLTAAMHELLLGHAGKRIILVSHSGSLDDIGRMVTQTPFGSSTRLHKANCGISIITCESPAAAVAVARHAAAGAGDDDLPLPPHLATPPPPVLSPDAVDSVPAVDLAAVAAPPVAVSRVTALPRPAAVVHHVARLFSRATIDPATSAARQCGVWRVVAWGIATHLHAAPPAAVAPAPAAVVAPAAPVAVAAPAAVAPAPAVVAEGDIQPLAAADASDSDDEEVVESGGELPVRAA